MSADGKIASPTRKQMRISSEEDIKRMYELRSQCDAVLVGVETVLADDPKLTVKDTYVNHPTQPLRIVLDTEARTPVHALVVNDAAKTLIITGKGKEKSYNKSHVEVIGCKTQDNGLIDLTCVLDLLYKKGVHTLLVEGGGTIIWNFLKNKVVDDLFVFIGPYIIGGKYTPTLADGEGITDNQMLPLKVCEMKRIGGGVLIHYQPL
jgi:2,5-diamino-6-(ribosylamino)-4(3H)-pyrimidinone 5'-phosphate reductase